MKEQTYIYVPDIPAQMTKEQAESVNEKEVVYAVTKK